MDRGALRGIHRDHPRPRRPSRRSSSPRRAEGKITAVRVRLSARWARTCSSSRRASRCSAPGSTAAATTSTPTASNAPASSRNTTPTDAYRGAGRPEATYAIERAVDALARELEMDPVELRRLNFITEFPATIASGLTIDSGDYDASLDRRSSISTTTRCAPSRPSGATRGDTKQLGIGFSTYVEMCGLAPSRILGAIRYVAGGWDAATIRCLPTGTVQVLTGTSPHGQGTRRRCRRSSPTSSAYGVDESRCCTATRRSARSGWTPTAAAASPSAASRSTRRRRRSSPRRATLAAHQLEVRRGRPRLRGRHVHRRDRSRRR